MAFDLNGVVETQLRNTIALLGRGFLSGPVAKDVQEHGNVCVNADKMDVIYLSVNALTCQAQEPPTSSRQPGKGSSSAVYMSGSGLRKHHTSQKVFTEAKNVMSAASNDALQLAVSISDTFNTAGCMALVQVFRGIAAILTVPCAILSLTQILHRPSLSPDQCNPIPFTFALSKLVFITLPGLFSILALRRLNMWKTRRAKPEDSHETL